MAGGLTAAAAAAVLAAVTVPVVRSLAPGAALDPAVAVTTTLTASGGDLAAMDCPPVDVVLPTTDLAFRGRAAVVEGDRVVLAVEQVYRGDPGTGVELVADLQDTGATVGGFPFDVGQEYLVSALQGTVAVCGGSGPVTPELQALYEKAFSG